MTYFIAEICSNHLNDLKRCKKMIDRKYLKSGKHYKTEKCKKEYCFLNNILYKDKKGNIWLKGKKIKNPFLINFD